MKPPLRFAIVFAGVLALVPFLPLYVKRTITHVMFAHGGGGAIEWDWKICTLRMFWLDYRYFRHQPHRALWITMSVALAFTYALALAFFVALILGWKRPSAKAGSKHNAPRDS